MTKTELNNLYDNLCYRSKYIAGKDSLHIQKRLCLRFSESIVFFCGLFSSSVFSFVFKVMCFSYFFLRLASAIPKSETVATTTKEIPADDEQDEQDDFFFSVLGSVVVGVSVVGTPVVGVPGVTGVSVVGSPVVGVPGVVGMSVVTGGFVTGGLSLGSSVVPPDGFSVSASVAALSADRASLTIA